jgi:hypothetical protein
MGSPNGACHIKYFVPRPAPTDFTSPCACSDFNRLIALYLLKPVAFAISELDSLLFPESASQIRRSSAGNDDALWISGKVTLMEFSNTEN